MEFDLADQGMVCGNGECRRVVVAGFLAGFYRDVVLLGFASELPCQECKTDPRGFDATGR
jgi:hypothetical protein